jgi:DNA-binding NtrC family response regulator
VGSFLDSPDAPRRRYYVPGCGAAQTFRAFDDEGLAVAESDPTLTVVALRGRILVVDDNVAMAENVAEILEISGYEAAVARSAEEALSVFDLGVGALVTDFRMAARNGAELIAEIRRRGSRIPAVVMCAHADAGTVDVCTNAGAFAVLPKPLAFDRLLALCAGF